MTSGQSVAMLAAHAAAKFENQVSNLVGHVFHHLDLASIFGIDEGPDVKTTHAGMAVVAGAGIVFVNHITKANKELRQLYRLDGAIFDERNRFTLPLHAKQKPKAGFPYLPNTRLCGRI